MTDRATIDAIKVVLREAEGSRHPWEAEDPAFALVRSLADKLERTHILCKREPVAWMLPLGEHGLIEWGQKRPDSGDINKWMPLCVCGPEYSDEFTGQIATPTKGSLLEDLRLLSNLERAHKNMSNSLFIENGQLRESLKDVLRMLEAAHRQSGIRGTDNKRIVAARSVLNAPPSLYAAPQPAQADEARELLREVMNELIVDPEASWPDIQRGEKLQERIDAYLARTGGKEEK